MKRLILCAALALACGKHKSPTPDTTATVPPQGPCGYGAYSVVTLNDSTAKALGYTQICAQEAIGSGETKVSRDVFKKMTDEETPLFDYPFIEYHRYQ